MQEKQQEARLKTYSNVMMSICYHGRCFGLIFVPTGSFLGQLVLNPLTGSSHDPDMQWFIASQESLENGLLSLISKELAKDARILPITDLQVGIPVSHIRRPNILF